MSAVLPLARHKLSVDEYHRMGDAGVLAPDSRVELIEGEVIDMAPIGSLHAGVVSILSEFFTRGLGKTGIVFTQNPIRLPPDSEPQPDIAILKPRPDYYTKALPIASDVLLLIEVADSSAEYDRLIKLPLYAGHGVPEVWLVDLQAGRVDAYSAPRGKEFTQMKRFDRGDAVAPLFLPTLSLELAKIWL